MLRVLSDAAPLVLGSASPRRLALLRLAQLPCVVHKVQVDEALGPGEEVDPYLERVVSAKMTKVWDTLPPAIGTRAAGVLVADTTVVVDGEVLGKPPDDDSALAMLRRLRGREHEVRTRFALGSCDGSAAVYGETIATRVWFRPIDDVEATDYVARGEGRDKAGAYAIQGHAAKFVSKIDGSYTNVVGLPLAEVCLALRRHGAL